MVLNTLRNGCCDSAPAASSAFPSRRVEAVTGGDGPAERLASTC